MKSAIQTIIISILVFGFYSCISDIDFERPDEFSDNLVIQGRVVKSDNSFVEVTVARVMDSSPLSRISIRAESVSLIDDQGNEVALTTEERGSYFLLLDDNSPVQAKVGSGYQIRVEMPDGRIFESSFDVMPSNQAIQQLNLSMVSEVESTNLGLSETVSKVRLSVDTDLSADNEGGLYWNVQSTYRLTDRTVLIRGDLPLPPDLNDNKICYITINTDVNRVSVFDFSQNAIKQIRNFEVTNTRVTRSFVEGYYFEVMQYSLSEDAIKYWSALDVLVNRQGNLFDSPAGEPPSNLVNNNDPDNKVFGYFFATEERVKRIRVPIEFYQDLKPTCSEFFRYCSNNIELMGTPCDCGACCDCLAEENSTLVRPDYWED